MSKIIFNETLMLLASIDMDDFGYALWQQNPTLNTNYYISLDHYTPSTFDDPAELDFALGSNVNEDKEIYIYQLEDEETFEDLPPNGEFTLYNFLDNGTLIDFSFEMVSKDENKATYKLNYIDGTREI